MDYSRYLGNEVLVCVAGSNSTTGNVIQGKLLEVSPEFLELELKLPTPAEIKASYSSAEHLSTHMIIPERGVLYVAKLQKINNNAEQTNKNQG